MFRWKSIFDIKRDSASIEELTKRIESDSEVTGSNLIILIMAIFIASIGLNMNSVAVIIGAMLISPLMGGIVATGYGMATYDLHFIKISIKKLGFQVIFALITASLYFFLSPITTPSSEMIARTTPTLWDVLIALFGGIAGAIGNTRKEKSNVIPGVAIATALMPPLCTAGYGISIHSFAFFSGALYLFFINSFFIALSSYIVFKVLRVPANTTISNQYSKYQKNILIFIGLLITIPSIYLAYLTVNKHIINNQITTFISKDMNLTNTNVISYNLKNKILTVNVLGSPLDANEVSSLQQKLSTYNHLSEIQLKILQGNNDSLNEEQVQKIINNRIEDAIKQNNGTSYKELANKYYAAYKRESADIKLLNELNSEAPLLFDNIISITGNTLLKTSTQQDTNKSVKPIAFNAFITVKEPLSPTQATKLKTWIETKINLPVILTVQQENNPSQFYGDGIAW